MVYTLAKHDNYFGKDRYLILIYDYCNQVWYWERFNAKEYKDPEILIKTYDFKQEAILALKRNLPKLEVFHLNEEEFSRLKLLLLV